MTQMDDREIDEALEPLKKLLMGRETVTLDKKFTFTTKHTDKTEVFIMANFDFENLKHKITEKAGTLADKTAAIAHDVAGKSQTAAKNVAGKAQTAGKKAKLNVEIASARSALKDKYTELGKLYYEKYAGHTDPDFAETAAGIEAELALIEAKQAEIEALAAVEEPADIEPVEETEPETEPDHITDEIEHTPEHEADIEAANAEETAEEARREFENTVDTVANDTQM